MLSLPLASTRAIATTPEVDRLVAENAPVAIGVSGGKDSTAVAIATVEYLDSVGHAGPRILIHADLGVTEWTDSLPTCRRLAELLGLELVVVRRPQGDMMDRWEQRWRDNVRRWESLSCVKIILPWSTPDMRFCTSELKIEQICRDLAKRWPGREILSVTGIRREESNERAKAPVAQVQPRLAKKKLETTGMNWNPIIDWSISDVFSLADERGLARHEAYTRYGSSRVSCVYCILGTREDHQAGTRAEENIPLARRMVALETASTFALQGSRWLGDTVAHVLTEDELKRLAEAKARAERRANAEKRIPKHLLYSKGWPTCVPTTDEARLLGEVRAEVADAVGLKPTYITPVSIVGRYKELLAQKESKAMKAKKKKTVATPTIQ